MRTMLGSWPTSPKAAARSSTARREVGGYPNVPPTRRAFDPELWDLATMAPRSPAALDSSAKAPGHLIDYDEDRVTTTKRPATRTGHRARDKAKVTINDIARLANVSKKTVSRVINDSPLVRDETRQKVKLVISEHGFAPDPQARALAFRRSFLDRADLRQPEPAIRRQHAARHPRHARGHELPADRAAVRPRRSAASTRACASFVEQQKLFGAILPPSVSEDQPLADILTAAGCPYVRIASVHARRRRAA